MNGSFCCIPSLITAFTRRPWWHQGQFLGIVYLYAGSTLPFPLYIIITSKRTPIFQCSPYNTKSRDGIYYPTSNWRVGWIYKSSANLWPPSQGILGWEWVKDINIYFITSCTSLRCKWVFRMRRHTNISYLLISCSYKHPHPKKIERNHNTHKQWHCLQAIPRRLKYSKVWLRKGVCVWPDSKLCDQIKHCLRTFNIY